ncbi:MAG: ADOP family duplicated permease [Gemmatimonadaceae bacterium]
MSIDRLLRIVPLRLRSLFRRDAVERELDDELRDHLECQIAENVRRGMSPDEARYAALRAMGGVSYRKEQIRDTRGTRWIEEFFGDLRFALRSLRHARGFSVTIIVTLALGIGANTAMFTLLRGTLLRPLPNRNGDRLVYLRQTAPGASRDNALFSVPEVADYRAGAKTLSSIAEYSSMTFTLTGDDDIPVRVQTGIVSGNYFDVLGLEPAVGRMTAARDDGPAASSVSVLSYQFWTEHFGRDPSIVGRTIRINDHVSTVIGVVQLAPQYPRRTDVFVNMVTSPHHLSATMVTNRIHRMTEVFARLAPNATVEQARDEITRISANVFRDHPESYKKTAQFAVSVSPLRQALNERASLTVWVLMGAALFVLLIACANVANLTLMRGVGREREMLIRAALGAGSGRLRRLLMAENLTLALIGGTLGVLVAFAALTMLVAFAAQMTTRAYEIRVDGVVLAVGLVTSLLAAIALSFIPRVGGERTLAGRLVPTGRRATLGRGGQRFQQSLVVAQLAVCMVLLTGAGLLVRTLGKLEAVETGVRADHVLTAELPFELSFEHFMQQQMERHELYQRVRDRVAALPGVEVASVASVVPLKSTILDFDVKAEDRVFPANEPTPHASLRTVDPNYFDATGMTLIAGRNFAATDGPTTAPVVILNKSFAERLFGMENPLGRRVAWTGETLKLAPVSGDWRTVVGVVGDTRDEGLDRSPTPALFEPFAQGPVITGAIAVRTKSDPVLVQAAVIRAIREVSPRQLIENVATLEQVRDEIVALRRLNAIFIVSFGVLALAIAMVGIAGVLAFSVTSRTAEIGIRMSLGAEAARVRRMILGEGGVLLVAGVIVRAIGVLATTRLLRGLLFGVTPYDPTTLAGVAVVLAAVGVASCWLPAARAARVDPAVALRAE